MARLERDGDTVHLRLDGWEKLGSLHGDLEVPVDRVRSVTRVDDLWSALRGMRAPGTGWPGVVMLGTTRGKGWKDFCAVYRHRSGVVVELDGQEFARWLITDAEPSDVGDLDRPTSDGR